MTANTSHAAGAVGPIKPLRPDDVAEALPLSAGAGWNQTADDWCTMLAIGRGWGLRARAADGSRPLVASTLVLPYGSRFAWISMVLVRADWQGQGLATQLMRHALDHLAAEGLMPVLDATPAGRAVYARLGFRDTWGFERLRRGDAPRVAARAPVPAGITLRALTADDLPAVAALDGAAFGADRLPLLRALALRLPQAAHVAVDADGRLRGAVLGRDGRDATQIGPLLARDAGVASALLDDALSALRGGPVYLDLCDHAAALRPHARALGFESQRAFTRMVRDARPGPAASPGDPSTLFAVAGPELG